MKKKPANCKWVESCRCDLTSIIAKTEYCEECRFYQILDSGVGWCKGLPEPIVVAWCKDICALFKK